MKFLFAMLFVVLAATGCTTRSQARMQAQNAYLAGQNQALQNQAAQQAAQASGVTILGPVQNSRVPWVEGLTLAQAVATANYLDSQEPKQIIITRQGESATLNADVLLNGVNVPLENGDVIELRP